MIVVRQRLRGVVYYVVFTWHGKRVWELAGGDKRAAKMLETKRLRDVKEGTYEPERAKEATTFGQWARQWLDTRNVRTAEDEDRWLRDYVLTREWLERLKLLDLEPRHMERLVDELKETPKRTKPGELLSAKSVANIYGIVCTLVRAGRIQGLITRDPCVLTRGKVTRRSRTRRSIYEPREVVALCSDPRLSPDARMWNALAFFTGMREGEVCGRVWADFDPRPRPLGSLWVDTQYDGQPLKTDDEEAARPRTVPVHPVLEWVLERWRAAFVLVHRRPPAPDDFIVPNRSDGWNHTKSSAYKMFRRSLAALGIPNRTLHATRHTFITMCRRGGARKDVLELVTHNSAGDILDVYTHMDWQPLCDAVLCLSVDVGVDGVLQLPCSVVEAPGIEPVAPDGSASEHGALDASGDGEDPPESSEKPAPAPDGCARHHESVDAPPKRPLARCDVGAIVLENALAVGDDVAGNEGAVEALVQRGAAALERGGRR